MVKRLTAAIFFLTSPALSQPITGQASTALAGLDKAMQGLLSKYSIPGAALAVSRGGILVYARGFGYADVNGSKAVQPDSLFRIASVSKTLTAVAIMELVQAGKIQLDQSAFGLLPDLTPLPGATLNPQLANITVRELLNMTGGWDRAIVADPIDNTPAVAAATGLSAPLSCPEIIQYQLGRPLQHPPGSTYAYSNFGYCVLGQIVAEVSGMRYVDYVRQNVLQPLGIQRTKQAEGLMSDSVNGEATYYDFSGAPLGKNVYNLSGPQVPRPYGNHDFEATQASGGWVSTTIDLLRFLNGIDGVRGGPLLQPATVQQMQTEAAAFGNTPGFYGLGFNMHTVTGGGFNWFKDGGLPGTSSYVFKGAAKLEWVVAFNSQPSGASEDSTDGFEGDYVSQIQDAIAAVTNWPTTDQFGNYSSTLVQPAVNANGVRDAASGLAEVTPGSWLSIYGTNLATASRLWFDSEFNGNKLPYSIDGVSVLIQGQPAPIFYASPTQLNVQTPLGATIVSPSDVVVIHDGQSSPGVKVNVVGSGPALYTYSGGGNTYGAAVLLSGAIVGDPSVVPGTVKAKSGDYVSLYGSGLLPSMSGVIEAPVTLKTFPLVTVGGVSATVSYAGLVSPGLFQINIQIPANVPPGNQQVVLNQNGKLSPSGVVIPIAAQ